GAVAAFPDCAPTNPGVGAGAPPAKPMPCAAPGPTKPTPGAPPRPTKPAGGGAAPLAITPPAPGGANEPVTEGDGAGLA
ncbi:MAG TPA: hypothetical protein VK689_03155, partial [Armatimonadota bacterium]|nr:hypothetical protein [Armatimonadota bacterium]